MAKRTFATRMFATRTFATSNFAGTSIIVPVKVALWFRDVVLRAAANFKDGTAR